MMLPVLRSTLPWKHHDSRRLSRLRVGRSCSGFPLEEQSWSVRSSVRLCEAVADWGWLFERFWEISDWVCRII